MVPPTACYLVKFVWMLDVSAHTQVRPSELKRTSVRTHRDIARIEPLLGGCGKIVPFACCFAIKLRGIVLDGAHN